MKEIESFTFHDAFKIQKFQLDNQLKVIIMEDHSVPVFSYNTWYNVGSRNEREGITGIAHLFEHLMFKETTHMPEGEFDRILEEQGGSINAATYLDWTYYKESLPKAAFPLIPRMEADRMQNIVLNDQQLNSEREVVANERRFRIDNSPDGTMYEKLYSTAFSSHPYRWPIIGWMEDISNITLADCVDFYRTYYAPNNASIVVVGAVETNLVLDQINSCYGHIAPALIPPAQLPEEPRQVGTRAVRLPLTISEEKLLLAYRIPSFLHPDHPAISLLQAILFGGKSSRLHKKLIFDLNIAAEVDAFCDETKDEGLFVVSVSMKPNMSSDQAIEAIDQTLREMVTQPVAPEELIKAVNQVETQFWSRFSSGEEKAELLGFYETLAGDFRALFEQVSRLSQVTPDQVQNIIKAYFGCDQQVRVVGVPQK